ncbi:hypothetical protein DL98DRAFT_516856 [Cadophora sp. DSE1049]|nr:hypothetical protein DL98DRAFT_516856 [Cadophora sp. DSE1049]
MADRSQSQRNRRRRAAESQQQDTFDSYASQPYPAMSPSYDFGTVFAQQGMGMPLQETTNEDFIMQDYMVDASASVSMRGSMSQSLSPSWMDVAESSPSVVVEERTNSQVMVHHAHARHQRKRAYSGNSNPASIGQHDIDFVLYPTPETELSVSAQEPWTHGAGFEVDSEAMADDFKHDPKYLLGTMWSAEPRIIEDPYQVYGVSKGEPVYQEMQNYAYQSVIQTQAPIIHTRAVKHHSDSPWSPVDPQVTGWSPGFTAFLPSPGPQGEHYSEGTSSRASSEPNSPKLSKSRVEKSRASKKISGKPIKGKSKTKELTWEHAAICKDGLRFVSENREDEEKRTGVRSGKLDPDVAEKAKRMRKIKACWKCWIQKVPCSEGVTCERCQKLTQFSPSADQLCCRAGFVDYAAIFFPAYLHSHLKKSKIEDLISKYTNGFRNTTIDVEVSTGAAFNRHPLRLHTNEFRPKTDELLLQSRLTTGIDNQNSELVERDSVPIGILGLSEPEVKKLCRRHIEDMIASPQYAGQVSAVNSSPIAFQLLQAMQKYAKKVPIVKDALALHAMHYFMGSLLTFTPSSVESIYRRLGRQPNRSESFHSSRLLSRQVKHIMHKLHRETTAVVLESLEKSLRGRTKDYWGPSFCAILVLCLCMENLQTAADTLVVCDMQKTKGREGFVRAQSQDACQLLEDLPLAQCNRLLHEIYRSHKEGTGGAREAGFNPLRALHHGEETGLDGRANEMIHEVYGVMFNNWEEMLELAERGPLVGTDDKVHPGDIRPHNTGRLVSKFLKSFLPDA